MSSNDKTLISDLMGGFVSEVPANPFVSFCVFCNKGVIQQEMTYQKGKVFHKDCYDKHGSSFPQINHELLSQNTNDKVQLVQLRNLKIRMMNSKSKSKKPKTKKKSKSKTKKRPAKRRVVKRKKTATKGKKRKKKTARRKASKNSRVTKRKTAPKRKKTTRKTKRRVTKRKTTRRR